MARSGEYDTNRCKPASEQQRYQLSYDSPDPQGRSYVAIAIPEGAQLDDHCGSLSLDQSGARGISAPDVSIEKCWNGR